MHSLGLREAGSLSSSNGPYMPEIQTADNDDQADLSELSSLSDTSDLSTGENPSNNQIHTTGLVLSDMSVIRTHNEQVLSNKADSNLIETNTNHYLTASTIVAADADEEMVAIKYEVDIGDEVQDLDDAGDAGNRNNVVNPIVAELMEKIFSLERSVSRMLA